MSRGRLIASLNYRSKGLIDMSVPNQNLKGMDYIEVYSASNLIDAHNSPVKMFEVRYDHTFKSSMIKASKVNVEESHRGMTRFIFNLNEYATTLKVLGSRVPTDGEMCFIRLRGHMANSGEFTDLGPIVGVVPFDFFGVTAPVFTCIGSAPDLDLGANFPDNLGQGCLNLHLPYFSQTISVQNLGASNLLLSCAPGMSPTVLKSGESFGLTSGAVPEFFFGGQSEALSFTLRCSLVNRG
jgi:hypothetical protein